MEEQALDALAFLTTDWAFFATNFPETHIYIAERPIVAVVPLAGDPFLVVAEISGNNVVDSQERGLLWIDEVVVYSEHPRVTNRVPLVTQWPETVAELLLSRGLARATIGVDALTGPMAETGRLLPRLTLVPVEPELRELRLVKHPEELELVRQGAALADWLQERYRDGIRPGRSTRELDYAVAAQLYEEAASRVPGEAIELLSLTLTGAEAAAPHGGGSRVGSRIEQGDGLVNIICLRLNGIWVENERTWFCGEPNGRQREAFEVAHEAQAAAIGALVAGRPLCGVDAAAQAVIERAGYAEFIRHRTGHGLGIAVHEHPYDMAFNMRALRTGEVMSAEPGLYVPGLGGFRLDDTVIVGEQPEVVTTTPKDLASQTIS
jgi:Xaa-Pro aminopeptidase